MKVLGFFVSTLHRHSVDTSVSARTGNSNSNGLNSTKASRPSLSRNQTPLLESELDADTFELLLTLKTIHAMLVGQGNLNVPRDLILRWNIIYSLLNYFYVYHVIISVRYVALSRLSCFAIRCLPLASLVRDDLGRSLVLLSAKRDLPPVVLQNVLGVAASLMVSLGPCLRILTECIFLFVYLKGLHQLLALLKTQVSRWMNA